MCSQALSHTSEDNLPTDLWVSSLHSSTLWGILTHKFEPPQQPKLWWLPLLSSNIAVFYLGSSPYTTHQKVPSLTKARQTLRPPYMFPLFSVLASTVWKQLLPIFCYFYSCWWHKVKSNTSYSIMSRSSNLHHFLICNNFILQLKDLQISIIFSLIH